MAGVTLGSAFFNSGKYTYTVPPPTTGSTETLNSLGVNLTPGFGWFISDRAVIGAQLSAGYRYDKNLKADVNNVTYYKNINNKLSVLAGAFARYYLQAGGSFLPFGQVSLNAGFGSSKHEGFNYNNSPLYKETFDGKSSGDFAANAGITVGFTKMLNSNVGLDITAGYLYSYSKNKYKTSLDRDVDINGTIDESEQGDLTTKYTDHGFSIGVGFQVFLNKKK